jgi:hypothetical protein
MLMLRQRPRPYRSLAFQLPIRHRLYAIEQLKESARSALIDFDVSNARN